MVIEVLTEAIHHFTLLFSHGVALQMLGVIFLHECALQPNVRRAPRLTLLSFQLHKNLMVAFKRF